MIELIIAGIGLALIAVGMAVTVEQAPKKQHTDRRQGYPVAAGVKLLGGTMCFITATGFATDVCATGSTFGGIVVDTVDNSGGLDGDVSVEAWTNGRWLLPGAGFAQSDVRGTPVEATDNFTITKSSAVGQCPVGTIDEYVDANNVWVILYEHPAAAS